jgi:hypothetical protein
VHSKCRKFMSLPPPSSAAYLLSRPMKAILVLDSHCVHAGVAHAADCASLIATRMAGEDATKQFERRECSERTNTLI